jgi:hypothetical protein
MTMKTERSPSDREVLAGLVERVTYHNVESGFCVIRVKARGHRELITLLAMPPQSPRGSGLPRPAPHRRCLVTKPYRVTRRRDCCGVVQHEHGPAVGPRATPLELSRAAAAYRHVLPVNRSMMSMMSPVELAITRETMLRSSPSCAPSIGRMKRRPMRISIP